MVEAQWLCRCVATSVGDVYQSRYSITSLCPPNSYEKGAAKGLISSLGKLRYRGEKMYKVTY